MSTKQVRWILLAVGLLLVILAFLISDVLSQNREFWIEWDLYTVAGTPDVVKLRILEVNEAGTTIVKVWSDSVNVNWTTHRFTIANDYQKHYFAMTAVRSNGVESGFSNIAMLDLARPVTVFGVKVR